MYLGQHFGTPTIAILANCRLHTIVFAFKDRRRYSLERTCRARSDVEFGPSVVLSVALAKSTLVTMIGGLVDERVGVGVGPNLIPFVPRRLSVGTSSE